MVVAILVWFASFFGYTITDTEYRQEAKDINYRSGGATFAIGASFRHEDQGGTASFLNMGYEGNIAKYNPKWGYHAYVRAYSGTSEFALLGISEDFLETEEDESSINDISIPLGVVYNVTNTMGLYVDYAPYVRGAGKASAVKITNPYTIGAKFKMSAFGTGFSPHVIYEFADGSQQFGLFASFDLF